LLIRFLGDYIVKHINQNSSLQEGQSLYLAALFSNPETVKMLNQNGMLDCSCLASTQEEADTRIILHALYSDKLCQENNVQGRIVVKSPYTDVLVLLVHYFPKMKNTSELWFQTGFITSTKDCRRHIPVHELCKSLSCVVCEILPAAHALTGCDTTSSFFGIGKKSMVKALKETPNQFSDLSRIECSDIYDSVDLSRKLISRLHDPKGKSKRCHIDLSELRVKLATVKDSTFVRLPPSEDTFKQHVLRSSYQAKIWLNAHIPKPAVGSPLEHGWKEGKFGLEPSDFLQDLVCTCKGRSVCSKGCVCFEQNLSCTELCPCEAIDLCHNGITHRTGIEDDDA
jgi:hypothetical protein